MTCEEYRLWFDGRDGEDAPAEAAAHLSSCPACAAISARTWTGVIAGREATARDVPAVPSFERVRGRARRRVRVRWATAWVALPVAAAIGAAVWVALPVGEPELEGITFEAPSVRGVPEAVETGAEEVDLTAPGTATIRIVPHSRIRVTAWGPHETRIVLADGTVEAVVEPRSAGEVFLIATEFAVVTVKGTRFQVTHRPGVETLVTVSEGSVQVDSPAGGEMACVAAGETFRVGPPAIHVASGPEPRPAEGVAKGEARPVVRLAARTLPFSPTAKPSPPAPAPAAAPSPPPDPLVEARRLLADGRPGDAAFLLRGSVDCEPGRRARVLALLGDAERIAGREAEAQIAYEAALATGPAAVPEGVWADLAGLLHSRQDGATESAAVWERYLGLHPDGRYAVRALVEVGLDRLDRGDLAGAAAWFEARLGAGADEAAEAALVGLMRVRLAQGRADAVRALAAEHAKRFPTGPRAGEVARILGAL